MDLSEEQDKSSGTTPAALDQTMPTPTTTPSNSLGPSPLSLSPSSEPPAQSALLPTHVPTSMSITELSSALPSTSGKLPVPCRIGAAETTSMIASQPSTKDAYDTATSSDSSTSSGSTIARREPDSTLKSVPTISQAADQPTAAKTGPSEDSSASSSTTPHPADKSMKSPSLSVSSLSSHVESPTLGPLEISGTSDQPCETTISTTKNSPQRHCDKPDDAKEKSPIVPGPSSTTTTTTPSDPEKSNSSGKDVEKDNEDEWEVVDETLLFADFCGAVESELMEPGNPVLIMDLDSESPLVQIGPAIFQGTYADCLGTNMIFEKHPYDATKTSSEPGDSSTSSASIPASPRPSVELFAARCKTSTRPRFSYVGKTSKILNLQRVFLKPKE